MHTFRAGLSATAGLVTLHHRGGPKLSKKAEPPGPPLTLTTDDALLLVVCDIQTLSGVVSLAVDTRLMLSGCGNVKLACCDQQLDDGVNHQLIYRAVH